MFEFRVQGVQVTELLAVSIDRGSQYTILL